MCGPRMKEALEQQAGASSRIDRRNALRIGGAALAGVAAGAGLGSTVSAASSSRRHPRVHDLTYRLTTDFATFFGDDAGGSRSTIFDYDTDGFYTQEWTRRAVDMISSQL